MIKRSTLTEFGRDVLHSHAVLLGEHVIPKDDVIMTTQDNKILLLSFEYEENGITEHMKVDCTSNGASLTKCHDGSWDFCEGLYRDTINISMLVPKSRMTIIVEDGHIKKVVSSTEDMDGSDVSVMFRKKTDFLKWQ